LIIRKAIPHRLFGRKTLGAGFAEVIAALGTGRPWILPSLMIGIDLSVGIVLLHLVPAGQHQPHRFAADNQKHQKLSPLIDRINDRYGRCAIGFGLYPPGVRAFKGHAAFHRVPESWEF
jgi:hypothetical protein